MLSIRAADPGEAAAIAEALADLDTSGQPAVDGVTGEVRFTVTSAGASAQALRRLDARGVQVAAVTLQQPTLDDVFLTLTGRPAEPQADHTDIPEAA